MKKNILMLAICAGISIPAMAQHHAHYYRSMDSTGLIMSGVLLGTVLTEMSHRHSTPPPAPVVVQSPQVVIERQPIQTCTEWREIVDSYGRVYRERTCTKY